jgi:hypothetical protein
MNEMPDHPPRQRSTISTSLGFRKLCASTMRFALIFLFLCAAFPLVAANPSESLYTIKSPRGRVTISLHRLRLSEEGRNRTTYFYAVRTPERGDVLYLPSALEDSIDRERTKFRECIALHWSPSESAFVLQETFPADGPCGRLHIVGSPRSVLQAIPYDATLPASVARQMKKHPERFHPYAPRTVVRVTDTEATIDFNDYRSTYRYVDQGAPRR